MPMRTAAIDERRHDREVDDREHDPEDLRDRDRPDVRQGSRAARRVVAGRAQPEEDHRHAHDDVARDHDAVVEDVALLDRRERLLEPEREHDHAEHLHHRREPHHPVVGVVGRREPRVVDPGPGDRERREAEAEDAGEEVAVREVVRELVRGDAERDDERQVVEQLERRRAAVLLVRVATGHPPPAVRAVARGCHQASRDAATPPPVRYPVVTARAPRWPRARRRRTASAGAARARAGARRAPRSALRRPSMSGRATRDCTGVTSMQPVRGESRRQDGHLDDQRALAPDSGDALDHLPVRHDVRPAGVERPAEHLLAAGSARRGRRRRPRARSAACGVETQRGQIIPGRRSTSATIVSKAALPAPITIAARRVVTGTEPDARMSAVSARLRR